MSDEEVTLRDGSRVVIRPIEPYDREALAAGFERLSPESRYRRFFGPVSHLRGRDLDYLTRVDHSDHEALVAVDPTSGEGVGVARYVATAPGVAEPAMVVVDDWQGRGVAGLLLHALVERAHEEGVTRFEAPVLADNRAAIAALSRLGDTTIRRSGREIELQIDLPAEPAQRRRALAPLLREFAAGALEPARTLVERLLPRRLGRPGDERRNLVVVGVDGSEHAAAAVEATAEIAAAFDSVVHVVGVHPFLLPDHQVVRAGVHDAGAALRERGLHVHERLRRGDPALLLPEIADEERARLLVVGAGGLGQTARRLIGSVADLVAERAPCDVLIVRVRD